MEILFRTQHGSRLYGLNHSGSDEDWFTVVTKKDGTTAHTRKRFARHSIVDGVDSVVVDFGTWLVGCEKGVPQFCEAMMSVSPEIDRIAPFRAGYRLGGGVWNTYLRTIRSFALAADDTIKKRRHALRLGLNLNEIGRTGRFNPRLSPEDAQYITWMSSKSHEDVYGLALCLAYQI